MDARHESFEQETLNELIVFINNYMQGHTEALLANNEMRNDIQSIVQPIYRYAHMWVDIEGVLSNKNFLSTDVVLLPTINSIVMPEISFSQVVKNIESVISKKSDNEIFYHTIQAILDKQRRNTES